MLIDKSLSFKKPSIGEFDDFEDILNNRTVHLIEVIKCAARKKQIQLRNRENRDYSLLLRSIDYLMSADKLALLKVITPEEMFRYCL